MWRSGLSLLFILAIIISCQTRQADQPGPTPELPEGLDRVRSRLSTYESTSFKISAVSADGGVIRVDILLPEAPDNEAEGKRLTMNALFEIQSAVGKADHLAVWSHFGDERSSIGRAFYSPNTETYHYKTSGETR